MRCRVCGTMGQREGVPCSYCGANVRSVLGKGPPLPAEVVEELRGDRREKAEREALRRKRRLQWHTVAGALVLFGLAVLANVAFFLLDPKSMLIGILKAVPVSIVFGAPIGFIVSWRRLGPVGGAFVGIVFFAAAMLLLGAGSPLVCVLCGVAPGVFVGGLIGFHVRSDDS